MTRTEHLRIRELRSEIERLQNVRARKQADLAKAEAQLALAREKLDYELDSMLNGGVSGISRQPRLQLA